MEYLNNHFINIYLVMAVKSALNKELVKKL